MSPASLSGRDIHELLHSGFAALNRGESDVAAAHARRVLEIDRNCVPGHFLVGLIALARGDKKIAVSAFGTVTRLAPEHVAAWAQLARLFAQLGHPARADAALARAVEIGSNDPIVQDLIGVVSSALGDQAAAAQWYARAVQGDTGNARYRLNLANSLMFLGHDGQAQRALDRALEIAPEHPQAHWLLATSRRATDASHLAAIERLLARPNLPPRSVSFLAYAAGKEYEDLECWQEAFAAFERGARARRSIIDYDEAADAATFDALHATFTRAWLAAARPGCDDPAPIFVVGQPRTGTTLVERIIASHSHVHSAGELQQFGLSLRRIVDVEAPGSLSAAVVGAAAAVDPRRLGEAYLSAVAKQRGSRRRFVDKLPVNYLYLPLIATALPRAKIVHVVRDPIDSCFASYKQLFADAYPHSYDQLELARHHVRYRRLMEHWRALLPGRFIEVVYEDVVQDIEPQARRLIDYLELPWQDACLEFHRTSTAVATASAVQVREPVHARSVARWRRYQQQLAPTIDTLAAAGLVARA